MSVQPTLKAETVEFLTHVEIDGLELNLGINEYWSEQIADAILELVLSRLPDKVKLDTAVYENYGDGYSAERIGYKHGYNDCLKEVRARLEGKA